MKRQKTRTTWMQLRVSPAERFAFTGIIMAVLILIVFFFNIPHPNMLLIVGLIFCSALFGFGGGIVAAVIMIFYTMFTFSTANSFVVYTAENLKSVIVSVVGIIGGMLLVCSLKQAEQQAFDEIDKLTEQLHSENEHLQRLSFTDALTGIRNRLALRQEYSSYLGHEVTAVMLDVDKFKSINDTRGHEEGDRILKETGRLLADAFGANNCFRYGGDEFLVISADMNEEEVLAKLKSIRDKRPFLENGETHERIEYSYGVASDKLEDPRRLRELFGEADERMYEMKRAKNIGPR